MSEEWRQSVEKSVKELYEEESWEVGSRLARATKAREDGYPDLAPPLPLEKLWPTRAPV